MVHPKESYKKGRKTHYKYREQTGGLPEGRGPGGTGKMAEGEWQAQASSDGMSKSQGKRYSLGKRANGI